METTTLSRLNLDKLRQIIVLLTRLPEERVLDGSVYTDVSKWDDFITVTPLVSHSIGTEVKFEAENRIIAPPPSHGGILSKSDFLPYRMPIPVGPYSLCPEKV